MLDLDRVEVVRVQAKQSEDGRSDLGGLDHGVDDVAALNVSAGDEDRDVAVLRIVTAVLGDLLFLAV